MEPGSPAPGQPHASGLGLVLDADLVDGAHLPSPGQQLGDLLADPGHPSGDRGFIAALVEGVGKLEAHTEEAHEQLVGGVGGALHTEFYPHHVAQGRHVPEVRLDAGLRRRSAQGLLELLLLGAGELGGVLITRVPGHHRAQPGRPLARQPVPNRSPAPVNHLGDNAHVNTARSVKNGLGLQSHQNKRVTAPLPPQKNIPLFLRHINKHARILYHAPRNSHLTQPRNAILFNVGHRRPSPLRGDHLEAHDHPEHFRGLEDPALGALLLLKRMVEDGAAHGGAFPVGNDNKRMVRAQLSWRNGEGIPLRGRGVLVEAGPAPPDAETCTLHSRMQF